MIYIFQYYFGFLNIKISGCSPERFMNLCSNHDIFLWNIKKHDDGYTMSISLKNFYILKPILKKTGTRVVILSRKGLPFFVQYVKKRFFFFAGGISCIAFILFMSLFIWNIDLNGNVSITNNEFTKFLENQGISVGTPKSQINIVKLEEETRSYFENVTWVSIKLSGTRMIIDIKENEVQSAVKEQTDIKEGYDLISSVDGTISDIITRGGVPQVKAGDEVHIGDILISGLIPVKNDDGMVISYNPVKADADVEINTIYKIKESLPCNLTEKIYSENKFFRPYIQFGENYKLYLIPNLSKFELADEVVSFNQIVVMKDFYLPVYYGTETINEYSYNERKYTKQEIKTIFANKLSKILVTLKGKGVQILEKNVTINSDTENWYMIGDIYIIEKANEYKKSTVVEEKINEEVEAG